MIFRWTPDKKFTFLNDACCRFFNLSPDQLIGHSFFAQIHEEDTQRMDASIDRLSEDVPYIHAECRFRVGNKIRWTRLTLRQFSMPKEKYKRFNPSSWISATKNGL